MPDRQLTDRAESIERSPRPPEDAPALAPSYEQVLSLQRSAGNAAVARALAESRPADVGVRASDQLWYFNGAREDPRHPTEVKLTAGDNAVGRFVWDVVEGAERVELGGGGGPSRAESRLDNSVNVLSRSGSAGSDDVRVRVSHFDDDGALLGVGEDSLGVRTPAGTRPAGTTSVPSSEPVGEDGNETGTGLEERDEQGLIAGGPDETTSGGTAAATPSAAPKSLSHKGTKHNADTTWGYETHETYEVLDDKGTPIKGFDINEKWPGAVVNDDAKADWRRGPAGGAHSSGTTFFDKMQGESSSHTPTPQNPQAPLGSHKVQHWDQEWYVGSTTPGSGTLVQTNLFQKYQDHAAHENIKSPP